MKGGKRVLTRATVDMTYSLSVQEYESAERCIDRVLQMEPNNYQAKQLKELIIKKLRRGI